MNIVSHREISLIDCLLQEFKGASKTSVKNIIGHGNIRVNGITITLPGYPLHPGDKMRIQETPADCCYRTASIPCSL